MKTILIIILLSFLVSCVPLPAQRYKDTNKGLYPNSIQITANARNTAIGLRYSHLFEKSFFGVPVGLYGSFSNTTHPDLRFINYKWERKYSFGGMITLPYDPRCMHTMLTLGVVRNQHPIMFYDEENYEGPSLDVVYQRTNYWGCDIGVQVQQKRFSSHITVDVLNFMQYVEFGFGYCFDLRAH